MNKRYSTTQVAKRYGVSANKLNSLLANLNIQKSFYVNNRKYWSLNSKNSNLVVYDKSYANNVTRPFMQSVMYWTEEGLSWLDRSFKKMIDLNDNLEQPTNALHKYITNRDHIAIQLISYNPNEEFNEERVPISETQRKEFCKDVAYAKFRKDDWFHHYGVDERNKQEFEKWSQIMKQIHYCMDHKEDINELKGLVGNN